MPAEATLRGNMPSVSTCGAEREAAVLAQQADRLVARKGGERCALPGGRGQSPDWASAEMS